MNEFSESLFPEFTIQSKKVRRSFTKKCKDSGFKKPGHYIAISKMIKEKLGLSGKKRKELSPKELVKVQALESLLILKMEAVKPESIHEVKPLLEEAFQVLYSWGK